MANSLQTESADAAPEDVVRAAGAAFAAERWADVVPLVAPNALAEFHRSRVAALIELARRVPPTSEQIQAMEPGIPPELAEHYANEERTRQERGRATFLDEWGVQDASELETLTAEEFLIRFLSAASPRGRLRASLALSHTPVDDLAAEATRHPPQFHWKVLGSVIEDDRYAHVLFRQSWVSAMDADPSDPSDPVRVTTLDRTDAGWRLRIDSSLLAQNYGMSVQHLGKSGDVGRVGA